MAKKFHVILGLSVQTNRKIESLQKEGKEKIYVMDYEQPNEVKEQKGVVYLSPKDASIIFKNNEKIVYHHYMYITPGSRPKKRRQDKD